MMDPEEHNPTIKDPNQECLTASGTHNGHTVVLSAEMLVKGVGHRHKPWPRSSASSVAAETSAAESLVEVELENMDDGSSESEQSTSTVNSPSLASTKPSSNDSFSSHSQDTMSTSMSATLAASNNNNYGHTTIITPDTTSTQQELRPTSPSSSHQKLKLAGQSPGLLSLSTSVNSSKPLSMAGQTVAPPMTMLSSFMGGDFKGGQAPVENLSLGGYMELITLQQGGAGIGANSTSFSLLPSSQPPPISSSTLQHISGTSSGLISTLNPTQTGLSGLTANHIAGAGAAAMPISINPHPLPTSNPPNYNSPQATNALFSLQPSPAAIVGGKPSSRPNFSPNPSSAFHQPFPGTGTGTGTMPQYSAAIAAASISASSAQATNNNKLNLLQHIAATDFNAAATNGANLSHSTPAPLSQSCGIPAAPLQNGGIVAAALSIGDNGESSGHPGTGGDGGGAGTGGGGRRGTKRSHEESIQQERNDVINDQEMATFGSNLGGKVNSFPGPGPGAADVGGCGPIAMAMDGRRGSTSTDPLSSQPLQQLKWQAHMVGEWHGLCDGALQDIPKTGFQVETDKGFNFSLVDDSFVCQKKNHFQVTVTVMFHRTPKFLKLKDGLIQPIERFVLDLHGVRFEQVNSSITLEQSKADRTKTKFEPDVIELPTRPEEPIKRTICRLHFSETTQNNMRKRGKPNPDQKHFSLVVSLNAETKEGSYLVVAHVSERIIVRASNPGNFDNDCDYAWLKGTNPEVVYHHGRVGINMDKPEEALSIHGNLHLTGQILQVSDCRVKKNITQLDSRSEQYLENISRLQLYKYQLDENLCPNNAPPAAPSAMSDPFNHRTNESPGYTDSRSTCFDDEEDPLILQTGAISKRSKDSLRSEGTSRSKDILRSRDTSSGGEGGSYPHVHTTKTEVDETAAVVERRQVGLMAQEVQRVLPNAVRVTDSTVHLSDSSSVSNLLVVDKDQILMQTIGAVQELKHIASGLQQRLTALEQGHCSYDLTTHGQKCTTTTSSVGTGGIGNRNGPARWHPKHILGLLMIASFLLLFAPLLLA